VLNAFILYSPVSPLSPAVNILYGITVECENPLDDQPLVLPRKSIMDRHSCSISVGDKVSVSNCQYPRRLLWRHRDHRFDSNNLYLPQGAARKNQSAAHKRELCVKTTHRPYIR
jgi:hypothetical protein